MNRRSFLKALGIGTGAVAAAPVLALVPAQVAPKIPLSVYGLWQKHVLHALNYGMGRDMLMNHDKLMKHFDAGDRITFEGRAFTIPLHHGPLQRGQ